jgi:hypothetical protein
MSTPVHDDGDVSGVTSGGESPGTTSSATNEGRGVSASAEPMSSAAAKPAGADEPIGADELIGADRPVEIDQSVADKLADKPVSKPISASKDASMESEAALAAHLKARASRSMPPPRSTPASARASEAAPEGERRAVSASAEPVSSSGAKPAGAAEPFGADEPAGADKRADQPVSKPINASMDTSMDLSTDLLMDMEAALAAHLKARATRPMPRPRSTPAPARAFAAAPEGDRRSDSNKPSQPSDPQSPPVAPDIREETDAPPTAPEAAAVRRPLIHGSTAAPNPISSMRLPQGLGGPNIAAPSALELLRARNAIPPGTEGLSGSSLPALSRSSQFEGDVAIRALRQRLALAPEMMAPPPVSHRSRSMMPSLARFSLVLLVASTVALSVALVTLPDTRPTILKGENSLQLASVPNTQSTPTRLIGVEGRQNFSNEGISLGISLYGASGSELALLSGLVSGTRLSVGGPVGDSGWRLPARDLMSALAYAPKDFIGVMNAAIDLRLPNDRLLDSRVMRLEWVPRRPAGPQVLARRPELEDPKAGTRPEFRLEPKPEPRSEQKPEPKPEPVPEGKPAPQPIDPSEVAALLKRGQDYLQNGDIVSARLMLRRAAAAGDPHAALLLGATFDPTVLRDLGVLGFTPDPAQARTWYQRAADAGLPEAVRRLERLTKTAR